MAPATQYLLGILIFLILLFHFSSYENRKISRLEVAVLRAFESFFLLITVTFWTHDRVASDADRAAVELGWPLNHVLQDQSRLDPPYPYELGWGWEMDTQYNAWAMSINWVFFLVCTYCVHWIVCKVRNGRVITDKQSP